MKETNMEHYRGEIEATEENEFCFGFAEGRNYKYDENHKYCHLVRAKGK